VDKRLIAVFLVFGFWCLVFVICFFLYMRIKECLGRALGVRTAQTADGQSLRAGVVEHSGLLGHALAAENAAADPAVVSAVEEGKARLALHALSHLITFLRV
jgi:hypothetical protein